MADGPVRLGFVLCLHRVAIAARTCYRGDDSGWPIFTRNVRRASGAVVTDSIVLADTVVRAGAKVAWSILDRGVVVDTGARIGGRPAADLPTGSELALVGRDVTVGPGVVLGRGARLEPGTTA